MFHGMIVPREARRFAALVLGSLAARATAAQLPSRSARSAGSPADAAPLGAKWWAAVGDKVFHTPSETEGLSQDVGDYYYAHGSASALTEEMRRHRVGGDGPWHIFHLPEGPSSLRSMPLRGGRRSSFSSLIQLSNGATVGFPAYKLDPAYHNPLSTTGQAKEDEAVAFLTTDLYLQYLKGITNISDGPYQTRAYSNPKAQEHAQQYLKAQMESMGLTTCIQKVNSGQANIIGFVPGQTAETVTVGAHYDSRPFTGAAPGANDNGSGSAAMLAIADAFMRANVKPLRNVYFVAFAAEEVGCYGSEAFAAELAGSSGSGGGIPQKCKAHKASSFLTNTKATHRAIAVDEVGWMSPAFHKMTVNLESYDWTQSLMEELAQSSVAHNGDTLDLVHNNAPFGSDHMSFLGRNMQAALIINGDDENYPGYHRPTDTLDKVTPEYGAKISKMILGALIRMSDVDTPQNSTRGGTRHRLQSLLR